MTGERPGREPRPGDHVGGTPAQAAPADQAIAPPPLLDQAFDSGSLYQLRASVAAHAGDAGMSQARAGDLVVAVHELAANVVRHGSGQGRLVVWRDDDELRCQVTDEGAGAGGSGESSPRASTAGGSGGSSPRASAAGDGTPWRVEPGHGLWLVRKLADRTSEHRSPHGVATTITFSLGPADEGP